MAPQVAVRNATMPNPDARKNDTDRYAALMRHRLNRNVIGDAPSVALVQEAAEMFGVAIASIGIVGREKVHFVAEIGITRHVLPRESALTTHVIASDHPLILEDTDADPRFRDHPSVLLHGVKFYAGAPLIDRNGFRLGAFNLLDPRPRAMPPADIALLVRFAARAMHRIELLSTVAELARQPIAPADPEPPARDAVEW